MDPQDLSLISIKDVCSETSVCSECLSCYRVSKSVVLFGHVADGLASSIHYDVFVCLLEAEEDIHHFQLALNNQGAIVEQ